MSNDEIQLRLSEISQKLTELRQSVERLQAVTENELARPLTAEIVTACHAVLRHVRPSKFSSDVTLDLYAACLDDLFVPCLLTRSNGAIWFANAAFKALLPIEQYATEGRSVTDFLSAKRLALIDHQIAQLQSTSSPLCLTERFRISETTWKVFELMIGRCPVPVDGQTDLLLWMLHDITPYQVKLDNLQRLSLELEEEVHNRALQVQKVLDFESMLKRVTDKVRDSLDESQILQTVVEELTLVLELGGCNSSLYDLHQGISTVRYEYISSIPAYQGKVAHMDNFPEIYQQLHDGKTFQFCSLVPNPDRGRVATLACPIFVDPLSAEGVEMAVLGDLWLIHRREHIFTESEIRLVQQVANQCAIAIRQARLYQASQKQVQELEKLNQLKDDFLSTVSHELRTPIANVKMATHMLKLATSEERRQLYLNILESETAREADLIDDLLDLQKLEASQHEIQVETISVAEWLPSVIEPFGSRLSNRQLALTVLCAETLPKLNTDLTLLHRILAELLNNACKYTSEGGEIRLIVGLEETPGTISDTGITFTIQNHAEIPAEDLPFIFDKFYRVIRADRYKQGGTGLGLALVQKRAEQLNGKIVCTSEAGWTTFTLYLPLDYCSSIL